jgi:hypothetical protein
MIARTRQVRGLTKHGVRCAVISLFVIAGGPVGAASAARTPTRTPGAAPTWQLVDYQQKACFSPNVKTSFYGIWINGTWKHAINVGIDNVPIASSYTTSYTPIPPGSSTGVYSLAYVNLTLKNTRKVGTYTASLWASDGTTRESVPVTVIVQASCRHY